VVASRALIDGALPAARGAGAFALLILALLALPPVAAAQLYRWVDEQGEVHVTDDPNSIPGQHRPRGAQPPAATPAPPPPSGSAGSARGDAPGGSGVALWLRTGGMRGEQAPILIQVYDSEEACIAERDRRTAVHARQGMQATSQPGLAMSNIGGTPAGDHYFAYRCVPAGIRPP
jgi:hypothetical protein